MEQTIDYKGYRIKIVQDDNSTSPDEWGNEDLFLVYDHRDFWVKRKGFEPRRIFEHLSAKLPISRLQRDLTDSTVLRNIGVPIAHTVIALKSLQKGLGKMLLNESAIHNDLEKNWSVVAEGIQTILRREAYPNPYEALKELTRTNTEVNAQSIARFIDTLNVSDAVKEELRAITPQSYTGVLPF